MSTEVPPLTGEERLFLSARVNRLCETEPVDFDPGTQLEEAQYIIDLLDPRLKPWMVEISGVKYGDPEGHSVTGSTDTGDVTVSFESDGSKRFKIGGGDELRTGMYVAVKNPGRRVSYLIFEHFWDRGENNEAFGVYPSQTVISYDKDSIRVRNIERIVHHPNTWGPFTLVMGDHFEMWPEKGKVYSRPAGLSIRFRR